MQNIVNNHIPVLLNKVIKYLQPNSNKVFIDGTFGGGGYTLELLKYGSKVLGIDKDIEAIKQGKNFFKKNKKLFLILGNFAYLKYYAHKYGLKFVDGIVLDLGVSSNQLNNHNRGFSFMYDGPLDMRMNINQKISAKTLINKLHADDLIKIIHTLGEEKYAKSIVLAITKARKIKNITRTSELSYIINQVFKKKKIKTRINPATRTFQALRIYVNNELYNIIRALIESQKILNINGRLIVNSFHSLEDRIVKYFLKANSNKKQKKSKYKINQNNILNNQYAFKILTPKVIKPDNIEIKRNPRSRSARLRVAEKISICSNKFNINTLNIPRLINYKNIWGYNSVSIF